MSQASAAVTITEARSYSAQLGKHTITGLAVESAWQGFTKYTTPDGAHLIVLDAEQRVVVGTPALMIQLGLGEPQIGDAFEGGIYAGMTEVDGKPARLILLPGTSNDLNWDSAMAWAKLQRGDLPTPAEQRQLYEHLKSEFLPRWYWSNTQRADTPSYAYVQYFDYGFQYWDHKSFTGSARAVRRLVIQ